MSVYIPPGRNTDAFDKNDLIKIFPNDDSSIFAAGDFNAKHMAWGSRTNDTYGNIINQFCLDRDLHVHAPDLPTHYPDNANHKPDIIDFAILKNCPYLVETAVADELDSDHLPVIHTVHLSQNFDVRSPRYNFSKTNWFIFNESLEKTHPKRTVLDSTQKIDDAIETITKNITRAVEKSTPVRTGKFVSNELPKEIKDLIQTRNKLKRVNRKHFSPITKKLINNLRRQITDEINKFKCNSWQDTVKNFKIKDHTLYQVTKVLTRFPRNIRLLKDENGELTKIKLVDLVAT